MRLNAIAACLGGLVLLVVLALTARGQTRVNLTPVDDNILHFSSAGSLSDRAGQYFFAGKTAIAAPAARVRTCTGSRG